MSAELKDRERRWLDEAGAKLRLADEDLRATFSGDQLATARVAYNLLQQQLN